MPGDPWPPEAAQAAEFPENHFGKFVLIDLLGRGGMGEVFRAWDKPLSRYVALKLLKDIDEENLLRFEREARVAAGLNHPHIAAVYEFGQHEGRVYIAMQYIDGKVLEAFAGDLQIGLKAAHQAAAALGYAHSKGVIHRDINPRNIMVDTSGDAFVMDFGIARRKRPGGTVTETGVVVGTPGYMSPEQAQGLSLDERTDIYSLGASLYFLCTHTPPFLGDEAIKIVMRVVNEDPPPIRRLNPQIDSRLATIIEKSMEKDPRRRYPTARELEEDLRRYLADEPILARRRPWYSRLYRKVRRHPMAAWGLLAFVALFVSIGTWRLAGAVFQRQENRREIAFQMLPNLERVLSEFELDSNWSEKEIFDRCTRFEARYREIMAVQPDFSYAHVQRARLNWLLGDRDGAFRALEQALAVERDNAQIFLDLGRYKLKEYISSKIQQTARRLTGSLMSPIMNPTSVVKDSPEMTSRLNSGLADFAQFQRLARRAIGRPGAGEADLAFAQAVQEFVQGRREEALQHLQLAERSSFVDRDARLFGAIVACEAGKHDRVEPLLAEHVAPTRDYVEARTYIAISLIFQLIREFTPQADLELVENLAHLMLLIEPSAVESALQLPAAVQSQLEPYFARSRSRALELRNR